MVANGCRSRSPTPARPCWLASGRRRTSVQPEPTDSYKAGVKELRCFAVPQRLSVGREHVTAGCGKHRGLRRCPIQCRGAG